MGERFIARFLNCGTNGIWGQITLYDGVALLYMGGCLAAPLLYPQDTSWHCLPPPSCDNRNCPQTLPNILLGGWGEAGKGEEESSLVKNR